MKKFRRRQHVVCLIMRISLMQLLLATVAVSLVSADEIMGQEALERKVSLNVTDTELGNVLKEIENQAMVTFSYRTRAIRTTDKVTLSVSQVPLRIVLKQLFNDEVVFLVRNDEILLKPKDRYISDGMGAALAIDVGGVVYDENGNSLPGVNVVEKGTTNGTTTDAEGRFTMRVESDRSILVFSFIGYITREVTVGNQTEFSLTLQQDVKALEEVVVVGYGTQKKSDLTGAVASVQGDEVAERQSVQVSQALQGAISGVMVTRDNSAPGSAASIRIRGITTMSDSNPLIIVDGVPFDNIDNINPNDIESISVLKDAASAAIYGARAAAGVILVTTKRGTVGQKSLVYNVRYGFEAPTEMPKNVDIIRYLQMANEQRWNDNGNDNNEHPTFPQADIENYRTLNAQNPDLYPITDWNDLVFRDRAPRSNHSLSFTTGAKNVRTNASFAYDKVEALYEGNDYRRLTTRINNDVTIIDNVLTATTDFYFNNAVNEQPSVGDIVWLTRRMPPQYAAEWTDGRVASGKNGDNPFGRIKYGGYNKSASNQLGGRVSLSLTPVKGLKFTGVVSPNVNFFKRKVFNKQVPYYNWQDPTVFEGFLDGQVQTSLSETRNDNYNVTTQFLANYMATFGKHDFNFLLGNENYYAFYENLGASRNQFELTSFPYLNLGPLEFRDNSGLAYENAYRSFFGRIMYNYANKYFLQTNVRVDGSSRFHKDHRWGSFPSFSAGWVISEESFFDVASVSFLKLRASWGSLGNERIGNYPYQATIAFNNALFYEGNNVVSSQTAAQIQYAIQNISWEKTQSTNIGVDAYFFDDRLRVTADYFHKTTKDMLLPIDIPDFIGFDDPDQNTGEMETKGWELEIGYRGSVGELNYSVSANLSDFRSIMGDLGGTEFLGSQVKKKGSEFNEWYGYRSNGLFQSQEDIDNSATTSAAIRPGDVKYVDISGANGSPDDLISPEYDRVLLGGSLPRYLYGGNIRLDYKGFDLLVVFQGVGKQNARLEPNMVRPLQTQNTAVPSFLDGNYWSMYNTPAQNLSARYPRLSEVTAGNNYAMSDFWLFNGAYMRMKNITLGYSIPKAVTDRIKIQGVRFYASVSDLFSIDKYPQGWDPEATSSGYPIMASYIFGASVKF